MHIKIILIAGLLAGCSGADLAPFEMLQERGAGVPEVDQGYIDPATDVLIEAVSLPVRKYGPVALQDAAICDVVSLVYSEGMGIPASCSASGDVTFYAPQQNSQVIFELLTRTLRSMGVTVTISADGIVVTGKVDGEQNTAYGASVHGLDFFGEIPEALEIAVGAASVQMPNVQVGVLPSDLDQDDTLELIAALGVEVAVVPAGGGLRLVGSPDDVAAVTAILKPAGRVVVAVPLGGGANALINGLSTGYPELTINYDKASGIAWFSGDRNDVIQAYSAARHFVPDVRQIRVSAAFISNASRSKQLLDISAGGTLPALDGLVILSGGGGLPFAFVVDASKSDSSASVLAEPTLTVYSGESAKFVSGDEIPVFGSFDKDDVREVTYRNSGITIEVEPYLRRDGSVYLNLKMEVVTVAESTGVDGNPIFSTQTVNTRLNLMPSEVVAISGFKTVSNQNVKGNSFFVLPDNSHSENSSELTFFVTVDIIS